MLRTSATLCSAVFAFGCGSGEGDTEGPGEDLRDPLELCIEGCERERGVDGCSAEADVVCDEACLEQQQQARISGCEPEWAARLRCFDALPEDRQLCTGNPCPDEHEALLTCVDPSRR